MLKDIKHTKIHSVQIYERENQIVKAVTNFIISGLLNGEAVIIVATQDHTEAFKNHLSYLGFDIEAAIQKKQLCLLDAHATLNSFMVDGKPNKDLFDQNVCRVLDEKLSTFPAVRAYGEMVNILWSEGNLQATLALESLWNGLYDTRNFALLCGYQNEGFKSENGEIALKDICCSHNHTVSEDDLQAAEDEVQKKLISELQYKTVILQNELAQRRTTERALRDIENELLKTRYDAEEEKVTILEKVSVDLKSSLGAILDSLDQLKAASNKDEKSLADLEINARRLSAISTTLVSLSQG